MTTTHDLELAKNLRRWADQIDKGELVGETSTCISDTGGELRFTLSLLFPVHTVVYRAQENFSTEPEITINGHTLSVLESMTVRNAMGQFHMFLNSEQYPLGNDEHGRTMTSGYAQASVNIHRKMHLFK